MARRGERQRRGEPAVLVKNILGHLGVSDAEADLFELLDNIAESCVEE